MRPNTKMFAFFDNENVTDFFRPDDVFTVTSGSRSNFDFNNTELPETQKVLLTQQDSLTVTQYRHLDLVTLLKTKHILQLT